MSYTDGELIARYRTARSLDIACATSFIIGAIVVAVTLTAYGLLFLIPASVYAENAKHLHDQIKATGRKDTQ